MAPAPIQQFFPIPMLFPPQYEANLTLFIQPKFFFSVLATTEKTQNKTEKRFIESRNTVCKISNRFV